MARQTSVEDGGDVRVVDPGFDEDGADDVENDDGVGACVGGGGDEGFASVPKGEVLTITSIVVDGDVACKR